jgi:hypothetical protein
MHNRIAVCASHSLRASDAVAFNQGGNDGKLFFFRQDIQWPCLSVAKAYIESGRTSISMAFGLLGCQPPLIRCNGSGVLFCLPRI